MSGFKLGTPLGDANVHCTWDLTVFLPLHTGVPLYCLLQWKLEMAFIHCTPYLQKKY